MRRITFVKIIPGSIGGALWNSQPATFGLPLRRGDIMAGSMPAFRMRRWYWPWWWKELKAVFHAVEPPLWDDLSIKRVVVRFAPIGPLFWGRKVWVFAP